MGIYPVSFGLGGSKQLNYGFGTKPREVLEQITEIPVLTKNHPSELSEAVRCGQRGAGRRLRGKQTAYNDDLSRRTESGTLPARQF